MRKMLIYALGVIVVIATFLFLASYEAGKIREDSGTFPKVTP